MNPTTHPLAKLEQIDLSHTPHQGDFRKAIAQSLFSATFTKQSTNETQTTANPPSSTGNTQTKEGFSPQAMPVASCSQVEDALKPVPLEIFQINLGKLCNMSCRHCHVGAGPDRIRENMDRSTIDACLRVLDQTTAHTVDITGGAPELNPHFRDLVDACVLRKKHVIDRCNLTVLLLPRHRDLPAWLAMREVEVVCSLPHYRKRQTDAQRGEGTYERSLQALRLLNQAGYGQGDPKRCLTLMSNPAGAFLAYNQKHAQAEWKHALKKEHGVTFDRLIALNNMPIARYLEWLEQSGNLVRYMELLVAAFNPATLGGLMCRNTLSVAWDGRIFDCDFNQMLELESRYLDNTPVRLDNFDPDACSRRQIALHRHCFGCTAGAGSSCGGAIEPTPTPISTHPKEK